MVFLEFKGTKCFSINVLSKLTLFYFKIMFDNNDDDDVVDDDDNNNDFRYDFK